MLIAGITQLVLMEKGGHFQSAALKLRDYFLHMPTR